MKSRCGKLHFYLESSEIIKRILGRNPKISYKKVGVMINCSEETVKREIKYLQYHGYITTNGNGQYKVTDDNDIPEELVIPQDADVNKYIFIVHGHNEILRDSVSDYLKSLGLNPIVLRNEANGGRTLIEKFEANANKCNYAIVLMTNDDIAVSIKDKKIAEKDGVSPSYKHRSRQNVVYEMGYFAGLLGRGRIAAIVDADNEKPGDIDGIVYIPSASWRDDLKKEIKAAGFPIKEN